MTNTPTLKVIPKPTPTSDKFDLLLAELKDIYVAQHEVKKMKEQLKDVMARLDAQQQKINSLNDHKQDAKQTVGGYNFD